MTTRTTTAQSIREQLGMNHRAVTAADEAPHGHALIPRTWERRGPLARLRRRAEASS